jgi:hypothetical protein
MKKTSTGDSSRLTLELELSPSMIYRELERYHIDTILDPMSSTSGAAGYFKLQDVRVISNDLALWVYVRGKALWENNHFQFPSDLQRQITRADAKLPKLDHYKTLGGDWLVDEERQWLEFWRKETNEIHDEYIRALAETAVCLVIDYWITAKRFGAAADWTPSALLSFYIGRMNQSLLDNRESNEMWWTDPAELIEKSIADVLFLNPPPLKGYAAFGEREHTIESWLRGMSDFPLERIAPKGALGSSFVKPSDYMKSFKSLLEVAEHIPLWAFALSNRQPFTRPEFDEMLKKLGRRSREIDLKIARHFFSVHASDTIVIAMK